MHIYCDESGGTDAGAPCFLVAAVASAPLVAERVVKQFRKRTRLTGGEVHGHELDAKQRDRFLRALRECEDLHAAVVVLTGGGSATGRLRKQVPEPVLRTHTLAEAVALVRKAAGPAAGSVVGVTLDGGRYKRVVLDRERVRLAELLAAAEPAAAFEAQYRDSNSVAGVQIADVVGNAVFRSLEPDGSLEAGGPLAALCEAGRLEVKVAELRAFRPRW